MCLFSSDPELKEGLIVIVKRILLLYVACTACLLTGCGSGTDVAKGTSEQEGANAASGVLLTSSVSGFDVYHDAVNTELIPSLVTQLPLFTNVTSLDSYVLSDGLTPQFSINTTGASVAEWYQAYTNEVVYELGGTRWAYARFGLFQSVLNDEDENSSNRKQRNTPFFLVNNYAQTAVSGGTYTNNGLAMGVTIDELKIQCRANVVYDNIAPKAVLSLTNCMRAETDPISIEGRIVLFPSSANLENFTFDGISRWTLVTSSAYKFGGPTGQELVGAVTLSNGAGDYFTIVFGARK